MVLVTQIFLNFVLFFKEETYRESQVCKRGNLKSRSRFPGPFPEDFNSSVRGWSPGIYAFKISLGDSDTWLGLRTSDLVASLPGFEPMLVPGAPVWNLLLPKQPLEEVFYICEMTLLVAHHLVHLVLRMFVHSLKNIF